MAQINVSELTFYYEGSSDYIFENTSFSIDTDWRLGLIGRNGKGKTTFLNLLLGRYEYQGTITTSTLFDYFPYHLKKEQLWQDTIEVIEEIYPDYELWKICRELELLKTEMDILYRPYQTLSHGEKTKVLLAILFSRDGYFLLIDEPTNHLDTPTRAVVKTYLSSKKGFVLVSHDRELLDACIDHVLVLERNDITVEQGNFSSWWENKSKRDNFEKAQNEILQKDIKKLTVAAKRTEKWANKAEGRKIGYDPIKEHDRGIATRAYIGAKSKRMQQQRKNLDRRQQEAIQDKADLLKNIEVPMDLKLMPLHYHKEVYLRLEDVTLGYGGKPVVSNFSMELRQGERRAIRGGNGCGKSTLIKALLNVKEVELLSGKLELAQGLKISYVNQDTSWLSGDLEVHIQQMEAEEHLFKAILRQLDFEREQFEKPMEYYSEGQKKKVLLAGSLLQKAHLYIWDEPLNYIDVFSRMQIEQLILKYQPTMLLIEHDSTFCEKCATVIDESLTIR